MYISLGNEYFMQQSSIFNISNVWSYINLPTYVCRYRLYVVYKNNNYLCKSPIAIIHQSGPLIAVIHQSGPLIAVIHQSGPLIAVIHQSGPLIAVIHQSGPLIAIIHQSGPLIAVIHQSGPLIAVIHQLWNSMPQCCPGNSVYICKPIGSVYICPMHYRRTCTVFISLQLSLLHYTKIRFTQICILHCYYGNTSALFDVS